MSMSVGGEKEAVMCDINTTPLIDVMLVLLVTLIVSLPIQTHAVKLVIPPPPPIPPETIEEFEKIRILVDFDDSIYYNGNAVTLQQVESYLKQSKELEPEILLSPDKRSHYDVTAKILAIAQRNDLVKIGFTNTVDFRE